MLTIMLKRRGVKVVRKVGKRRRKGMHKIKEMT